MRSTSFSRVVSTAVKKTTALTLAASFAVVGVGFINPTTASAAMTAMSIDGTGINANSADVSTAITPTINFTPANAIGATDTLTIAINGVDTVADITAGDITPGGGCTGTPAMATITNPASDPVLEITGLTCTAAASSITIAASILETSATASNYGITVTSPLDTGSFFFYVGDENDVTVTATVDSVFSFVIRTTADDGDQPNVGGAAVGPNLCNLGNLSAAGVNECSYRLKVATNAANGYDVNIATDGALRDAADVNFIANVANSTAVATGIEGYGIEFDAGGSSESGVSATAQGDFTSNDTPTATGVLAGINTALYNVDGPNNPTATDIDNTALVTHRAEADAGTPAGSYSQLVTYTVSANF